MEDLWRPRDFLDDLELRPRERSYGLDLGYEIRMMEPEPIVRYDFGKPSVGPRGGKGNRAKTKAGRKANLQRRMRP